MSEKTNAECPYCGGTGDLHNLPTVTRQITDADREKVRDAIAEALGCMIYCCTRTWSAWGVGTMSQNDFVLASEDDGILDELTAAAISAIEAKPESGSAS